MATLKELANRTGYSTATISRILSGDPSLSVTPEARRKVLEEAGMPDAPTSKELLRAPGTAQRYPQM